MPPPSTRTGRACLGVRAVCRGARGACRRDRAAPGGAARSACVRVVSVEVSSVVFLGFPNRKLYVALHLPCLFRDLRTSGDVLAGDQVESTFRSGETTVAVRTVLVALIEFLGDFQGH